MTDFQTREVTRIRFKDWDSVEVLNLEKLILTFEAKAKSQDIGALCYLSRAVKSTQDRSNGRPVDLSSLDKIRESQIKTLIEATDGAIAMLGAFEVVGAYLNFSDEGGTNRPPLTPTADTENEAGGSASTEGPVTNVNGVNLDPLTLQKARGYNKTNPDNPVDLKKVISEQEIDAALSNPSQYGLPVNNPNAGLKTIYTPVYVGTRIAFYLDK